MRIDVAFVLKYNRADRLERLLDAQGDSTSPFYHHFLTSAQFNQYFAPTPSAYDGTITQLTRAGFTVTATTSNRTIIDASAPASTVDRFFSTNIHNVRRDDGQVRYVNIQPPVIPASFRADVLAVVGLDSAHAMLPQYARLPNRPANAHPSATTVRSNGTPLFGPDGGYGPQVFRISYGFPEGVTGKGRASGVATDADFLDADLNTYLKYFAVPRSGETHRIFVDGGPPRRILTGDSLETTFDVETLTSIAPGTTMYVYETSPMSNFLTFTDLYNKVVTDNLVDTLNTSFSECETIDPNFTSATEAIEAQGSALGITFHSSTGDVGSLTYGCGLQVTVAVPASTIHNVAVGGTFELVDRATGEETSETGWNDGSGITGGGVSTVFAEPSYQQHVKNIIAGGRNIPDLSFDASAYTGESVFYDYNFNGPLGGTSLSSPIFGAALAVINQMRTSRSGYFNPELYRTWRVHRYVDGSTVFFRDIASGSIPPYYYAVRGYDQVTGIGTMQVGNFGSILP